ncbi:MAG: DMT family transporter [Candidatus Babeliaceae bacterium]|jgi:drug/metabolite transporter (DMT)-like permease
MILVILINALFSLVFPLGQIALRSCPPFFIIGLRMLLGGTLLLGYWLLRGEKQAFTKSFIWHVFLLGVFNIYLTNAFEFWGLQYMTSAKTCFLYNLSPFFSAFFAYLHFGERMTYKKWLGLGLSFAGFIPIMLTPSCGELDLTRVGFISTAELALIIATMASVYGWIIMQDIVRHKQWDSTLANGLSMVLGGLLSYGHSLLSEAWNPTPVLSWWPFLGIVIVITLISNIFCYSAYAYSLRRYTATFMAFSGLMGPFFAALYDWLFFGIAVSGHFYIATVLVAAGVYLFYHEELRQGYMIS